MSKEPTPQENARLDRSELDSASEDASESRLSASAEADAAQNGETRVSGAAQPLVAAASVAEIAARAARAAHHAAIAEREAAAPTSDTVAGDEATDRAAPQPDAAARPANPLFTPAAAVAAAPAATTSATAARPAAPPAAAPPAPAMPGATPGGADGMGPQSGNGAPQHGPAPTGSDIVADPARQAANGEAPRVAAEPDGGPHSAAADGADTATDVAAKSSNGAGTPAAGESGTADGAADAAAAPASGDAGPGSDDPRPRKRAPRFPPGAARPGVDKLPPAYGGPLGDAATDDDKMAAPVVAGPVGSADRAAADTGSGAEPETRVASEAGTAASASNTAAGSAADTPANIADNAAIASNTAAGSAADTPANIADNAAIASNTAAGSAAGTPANIADNAASATGTAAGAAADTTESADGRGDFWRRRPVVIAGTVVAGLLVLYGAAYAIAGSGLARNASVLGIDIGGMSQAEAEAALAEELPALVDQPIDVQAGTDESDFTLIPSESGLTVDIAATVESVPGGNANPISLVRALLGGGDVTPVATVDRSALTGAIEVIAEQVDVEPVNGSVGFDDGEVVTSGAEMGSSMDVAATADTFEEVYFGVEGTAYSLPLDPVAATINPVEPAVTDDDVAQAVADFAEPAMSAPVTVVAGDHDLEITPGMLSEALSVVTSDDGVLTPELDGEALSEAASDVLSEVGRPGRDATIEIQNDTPVIIPEESGVGVVPEDLAAAVLPALTESGADRSASVEFEEIQPEFTAADAEALGVTEVISEFKTYFQPTAYRNTNIGTAAGKINNTLLLPGDTFSLNGLVGERTAANGFARGAIISGGQLIEDYGGGVSQVATTTYHTAFKAGLEDVEHRPHTIYYGHYPVGAEATVSWGNFDMAFKNDTPYGVLVQTIFTPSIPDRGSLEVKLWSTKYFEVETSTSEKSNFTSPPPASYNSSSNCYPNTPSQGFSVTTYRKVWDPDGDLLKDESYPWTYKPSPEIRCGEDPSNDD